MISQNDFDLNSKTIRLIAFHHSVILFDGLTTAI